VPIDDDPPEKKRTLDGVANFSRLASEEREARDERVDAAGKLFAAGWTIAEVSAELRIAPSTAEKYRGAYLQKRAARAERAQSLLGMFRRSRDPPQCREVSGPPCVSRAGGGVITTFCGERRLGHHLIYRRLSDLSSPRIRRRLGRPCPLCVSVIIAEMRSRAILDVRRADVRRSFEVLDAGAQEDGDQAGADNSDALAYLRRRLEP